MTFHGDFGAFMITNIPNRLNKSALISVSFEIRFEAAEVYSDLIALNLANTLIQQGGGTLLNLPVMQLPPTMRSNDVNFRYAPLFGVKKDNLIVQVGPRVLVITVEEYPGWKAFYSAIKAALDNTGKIRQKTERLGLRTINFFENDDIENNLTTVIQNGVSLEKSSCNFSIIYKDGDCQARFSFANKSIMAKKGESEKRGSYIDIDSFIEGSPKDMDAALESLHNLSKKVFFESLKQDFIDSLEPNYDVT